MSKRKYSDGPTSVLTTNKRTMPAPMPPLANSSLLGKRSLDTFEPTFRPNKRLISDTPALISDTPACRVTQAAETRKRAADFDFEIDRLHKRLKATTPTAEEALGFLLPHLLKMRRLYLSEREKVSTLLADYNMQKSNNVIITKALREQLSQKNVLQRQLDFALYRLSLHHNNIFNVA